MFDKKRKGKDIKKINNGNNYQKFRITTFKKEIHKIKLKKISLSFHKRQILDDISINIREGEICGLLGPNGVGKSSLFNIILGLIKTKLWKYIY